jgi:Zn-dependent protease
MNQPVARCEDCHAEIAPGLLACPGCAKLVHGAELSKLAEAATAAEKEGDLPAALASWRRASELLPVGTTQLATIQARMKALSAAIDGRGAPPPGVAAPGKKSGANGRKAAGLGAVGLALLKAKTLLFALLANGKLLLVGLTKLPTLLSILVYAQWTGGAGMGLGLGFVACMYVHEVGHVAALRRYGIEATAPMFVPGFGAFVRLKQYPTDAHEEARTGLAGPLWGLVASLGAAAIGAVAHLEVALGVASASAWMNLFNLLPVWQLDGARGMKALSRNERLVVAAVAILTALVAHQWMPAIVGLVMGARAFEANAHPEGDTRMLALFVALIVALAAVGTLMPLEQVLASRR